MKKLLISLLSTFLIFNCYARKYWSSDGRNQRDNNFFNPNRHLEEDVKASKSQLEINNNRQELEKSKIRHRIEMEKLRQQQLNQQLQFEKEKLQKKLEILKLQQEVREREQKGGKH